VVKVALRYACIAAWLARLGLVRFCLARVAGGSPQLAWAATSAFGAGVSSAVQRIAGEIRKLPAPILPVVRGLWSQPKSFLSLGQHVAALPVSAAQAAALSSLGDLPLGCAFGRPSCGAVQQLATRPGTALIARATCSGERRRTLDPS